MRRTRAAWATLGLVPVALAAAWSLASGLADRLGAQAQGLASSAPGGSIPIGSPTDLEANRLLEWARRLDPGNPLYGQRLGQHLERLASQLPPGSLASIALLRQARGLYLAAARRRPTWSLSLTPILRTDLGLGRLGADFNRLYRRATVLGGTEPSSFRALVDLGLVAWPRLDPDGRQAVADLLALGLQWQPRLTIERAAALRRLVVLRPLVSDDPRLNALYREIAGERGTQAPGLPTGHP